MVQLNICLGFAGYWYFRDHSLRAAGNTFILDGATIYLEFKVLKKQTNRMNKIP